MSCGDQDYTTYGLFFTLSTAPQGWECPVCKSVYAPGILKCTSCPKYRYPALPHSSLVPSAAGPYLYDLTTNT